MDLVKIINTSPNKNLSLECAKYGPPVVVAPGKARILPAEYATVSFGNPAARDIGKNRARETEFNNARTFWGFYPGLMPEQWWLNPHEEADPYIPGQTIMVPRKCPPFECYDPETDERIYMVVEDPDGSLLSRSLEITDGADTAGTNVRVAALERQLAQMAELLQSQNALMGQLVQQQSIGGSLPVADGAPLPDGVGVRSMTARQTASDGHFTAADISTKDPDLDDETGDPAPAPGTPSQDSQSGNLSTSPVGEATIPGGDNLEDGADGQTQEQRNESTATQIPKATDKGGAKKDQPRAPRLG